MKFWGCGPEGHDEAVQRVLVFFKLDMEGVIGSSCDRWRWFVGKVSDAKEVLVHLFRFDGVLWDGVGVVDVSFAGFPK